MKSQFLGILLAVAAVYVISATAQTGNNTSTAGAATAAPPVNSLPSAPGMATGPTTGASGGIRIGAININEAIFGSNEGRRDIEALQKKFEPKQTELKNASDELDGLKKQLETQGPKLNEDAAATLKKQIDTKQKTFDRSVQDAQEDFGGQQQEIAKRILSKMAPMIVKYAQENGFGMIVDTSKQWPESPVLWWNEATVDITKAVVDAYNAQSGVPAPAPTTGAAKPPASKPAAGGTTANKPATPAATKPN
jgi:outer membrane protein